jgi:hypothetical protein
MSFRSLAEGLRDPATQVITFLRQQRGLARVWVEEELVKGLPKPTLRAHTAEGEIVCVEFSETDPYPQGLARFVEDLKAVELPVKMYVALPSTAQNLTFMAEYGRAHRQGIGLMLVEPAGTVNVLGEPVSLLLAQLRRIDTTAYPKPLRERLSQAQSTFLAGNPPKGCSDLYDLLEEVTRKIVAAAIAKNLWNGGLPAFNPSRENWHTLCEAAYAKMQFNNVGSLTHQLWASVLAITRHRNETGHSPATIKARKRRDLEMRTRFEHAADVLRDVLQHIRGFRI